MIEIIEDNAKKFTIICDNCKSVLRFKQFDINHHVENLFGQWHDTTYITCPCCKTRITLSTDGKVITQYDLVE